MRFILLAIAAALMSGCVNMTSIDTNHPLLLPGGAPDSATIYFIRPEIERRMGFPDNPLTVEMNQEKLMSLGRGEYTAVTMVARDYTMTLRNKTEVGPNWQIKELAKSYRFTFEAGKVYYLLIKPVDGEFRGVFFKADAVDLFTANQNTEQTRAVSLRGASKI